jgi:hypothetical protein
MPSNSGTRRNYNSGWLFEEKEYRIGEGIRRGRGLEAETPSPDEIIVSPTGQGKIDKKDQSLDWSLLIGLSSCGYFNDSVNKYPF